MFDKQLRFIISAVDKATWPIKWIWSAFKDLWKISWVSLNDLNDKLDLLNKELKEVDVWSQRFKDLQKQIKLTEQQINSAEKWVSLFQTKLKSMKPVFENMATYGWIATTAILWLSNQMIKSSSDLNESVNAVNVVFWDASKKILEFWETASKSAWLSKSAFNQLATPIWAMLTNMWYSADSAADSTISLTQRAADMASVFNTDVATAMQAIQAGIRWEIDPLEKYWVSLSDASIKAYALSQWLIETNREMTNEEKTRARVALLMEQTNKLGWDFVNTSWEEANATRILNADIANLSASIWTQLLPLKKQLLETITPIVSKISEWIKQNPELTKNLIIWAVAVAWLVTVLWTLWLVIPTIITWFTSLVAWLTAVKLAFIAVWWPITILIALLATLAIATYQNWDKIKQWFNDWIEAVKIYVNTLPIFLSNIWNQIKANIEEILIRWTLAILTSWLSEIFIQWAWWWDNVVNYVYSAVQPMVDRVQAKLDAVVAFVAKIKAALDKAKSFVVWDSAPNSTPVSWARALWWTVSANKSYLVWERWPELFTPSTTWKINNNPWWSSQVIIQMWWVTVNNEADENRLVQKIKETLIRDTQLYNYWVS